MGQYQLGTAITLRAAFDKADVPTDPTTVTFAIRQPDNVKVTYVYGVAPEVERLSEGVYTLALVPPMEGEYRYQAIGTGAVVAVLPGDFVVFPSNVDPPVPPPPGPMLGPCQSWISGADIAACCSLELDSSDKLAMAETSAIEASMALYEISGRQFTGLCERVVRPCKSDCGCWGSRALGLGPWAWSAAVWGYGGAGGWGWVNEAGDRCGCGSLSRVKLSGYPVRQVTEVKIGGVVLDPLDDEGNPNWRLDQHRWLTRLDAPGPPVVKRHWPHCQNLALDDDQAGTFSVAYLSGIDPPELGRRAAAVLGCELLKSCLGAACALPTGTTRVQRQGVTVERGILANWFDPTKATGLPALDLFLKAYWGNRRGRRPAVSSPDVQKFARREGV